jgi:voltage-gated potassium channel Kch
MTDRAGKGEGPAPDPSLRGDVAEFGGLPIRERYGLVLLFIFIGYILAGVDPNPLMSALTSLLWVALLLTTLWSPGLPSRLRRIGLAATALLLVTTISLGFVATDFAEGWRLLILAVALFAALLAILFRILQHERVTAQTVMGGISAYALIAFAMSTVYHGLDLFSGAAFLNGVVDPGDYTYFSFVTLTTVGYGDITAASDLAKRLVVVEAFVGQVFLITLVARLVSLWGKRLR